MINHPATIERILLVKLRYHGDMLLTTPLINTLKYHYPNVQIDLLLYRDTVPILDNNPNINHCYGLSRKPIKPWSQVKEFFHILNTLKKNQYSLIINLADQWPIAYLLSRLGSHTLAFDYTRKSPVWRMLCDQLVPLQGTHTVERNLSILAPFNLPEHVTELSIYPSKADWLSLIQKAPMLLSTQPYVVIQPTARFRYKCWQNEKFATVIDHLHASHRAVYLTCGPSTEDMAIVNRISALCQHKPHTLLAGNITLLELATLIQHAVLYIGVDSAPMHIAATLKIPSVVLFGATHHHVWHPWQARSIVIWAGNYATMPKNVLDINHQHRYLNVIPVVDVINAINQLLKEQHPTRALEKQTTLYEAIQ